MEELGIGAYSDNHARVIREWELRSHLGQVLTIVDSLGLQERQGKAVKDLLTQHTWRDFWNGGSRIIVNKEAEEFLVKALDKQQEQDNKIQ